MDTEAYKESLYEPPSDLPPEVKHVAILICNDCLIGMGGECHQPYCAFWGLGAPEVNISTNVHHIDELIYQDRVNTMKLIEDGLKDMPRYWDPKEADEPYAQAARARNVVVEQEIPALLDKIKKRQAL